LNLEWWLFGLVLIWVCFFGCCLFGLRRYFFRLRLCFLGFSWSWFGRRLVCLELRLSLFRRLRWLGYLLRLRLDFLGLFGLRLSLFRLRLDFLGLFGLRLILCWLKRPWCLFRLRLDFLGLFGLRLSLFRLGFRRSWFSRRLLCLWLR
jgi:hypothetical protein